MASTLGGTDVAAAVAPGQLAWTALQNLDAEVYRAQYVLSCCTGSGVVSSCSSFSALLHVSPHTCCQLRMSCAI